MILGDNIGSGETLETELKEFMLKIDPLKYFSDEDVRNIIHTGKITNSDIFNTMIIDNINHYFEFYLPKYISVFGTSELAKAELYIGVNDFGEITGVPYFGDLNEIDITKILCSIKDNIKIIEGKKNVDEIIDQIKIEIIKLETDETYLDDNIDEMITEYFHKKTHYEKAYYESINKRTEWKNKLEYYTTKIMNYLTKKDYRMEIANFIRTFSDYMDYDDLIKLFESDDDIILEDYNEITYRKLDKKDPIYWVTEFKDMIIEKVKNSRPIKIPYMGFPDIYMTQIMNLSNLRLRFLNNNTTLNYYLIKISLPTNLSQYVYFKMNDAWITRTRALINGAPGCI